ncbi:mechanosensitive ion channel family protein [Leisingera aquimarina]|uniref:mechanosensitive ion channel family protein n=1 Tax=Leisingera aquimarina TaxID=476529 RepID=UPI0004089390|nr:mechanosensitive ion channel domain-containing protein [Leisingera aquimarina]
MDEINDLMKTEIYGGKSLADLVTLEFLAQALGNVLAATVILLAGFVAARWVKRRIVALGDTHAKLDVTLFHFLGTLARHVILAFAVLFVLNTFGVKTTSIVAAIGAAGLAIGLAMQGALSNVAAGVMIILFRPFIQVNALNSSSVDFLVRVWVDAAEYFQYQADMKRKAKEALDATGVDIPFPTRTLVHAEPASQEDEASKAA